MSAQGAWSDREAPEDRLEGIIMVLSDFHAMMNLIDVTFKTTFTVRLSREPTYIQSTRSAMCNVFTCNPHDVNTLHRTIHHLTKPTNRLCIIYTVL